MTETFARMRQIIGSTADWSANDLVLALGEIAVEQRSTTDFRFKVGDGTRRFSQLPYAAAPLDSPLFVGTPSGPTPPANDSSTRFATTSWVQQYLALRGQTVTRWKYAGTTANTDPGAGNIAVEVLTGDARKIAMSKTDADGQARYLLMLQPGDTLIITDDPASLPVTDYARYDVTGTVIDHNTWVEIPANLVDASGTASAPPIGTPLRVSGFLNMATGDGPILAVTAGEGLTGGGSTGDVDLAVDFTIVAKKTDIPAPATGFEPGDVKPTFSTLAQPGWLRADGTVYKQADKPALFAAIGTTHNTGGEASDEFRVPDMDGRAPFGEDNGKGRLGSGRPGGITGAATLGATGGEQNHVTTNAETAPPGAAGGGVPGFVTSTAYGPSVWTLSAGANVYNASFEYGGLAHNNIPPGIVVRWLIKE